MQRNTPQGRRLPISTGELTQLMRLLIVAITAMNLVSFWAPLPTEKSIRENDQAQNMRIAYHLVNSGTFSEDNRLLTRQSPTDWREPLPPFVLAIYMTLMKSFLGELSLDKLGIGQSARILKFLNVLWGIFLSVVVFISVIFLSGSYVAAAFGTIWANYYLEKYFDSLYTEVQGSALLVASSLLLCVAIYRRKPIYFILCGLSFGALILTKAAFLYVTLVIIILLFGWWIWLVKFTDEPPLPLRRCIVLMTVSITLLIVPWMMRNYLGFGSFEISQRGGQVLMIRAIKNQMSWTEYRGAIWVWAPPAFGIKRKLGQWLGFDRSDLERGGRLQHLNRGKSSFNHSDWLAEKQGRPEDAVSYWRIARAMYKKAKKEWRDRGVRAAGHVAESELKTRAMRMILSDLPKHMATTPLFLWRGAPFTFPILLCFAAFGLLSKRLDLLAYGLPSLIAVLFYAGLSHNIPRYNYPMDVVAVVCLAVIGGLGLQWLVNTFAKWQFAKEKREGG
jgi:hypothetical protein